VVILLVPPESLKSTPTCPRCGTPISWEGNPYRPFCSRRCRELDLLKWLKEEYRIPEEIREEDPGGPSSPEEDEEAPSR